MRAQATAKGRARDAAKDLLRGGRTAVAGSGPAALDAARMAARLGQEVDLVFGGLEEELGVDPDDLKAAIEEGVRIQAPVDPLAIDVDAHGFAQGLQGQRLDVVESQGKFVLEAAADGRITIEAQTVILAYGRKPNPFLRKVLPQLKFNANGTIWMDPQTGLTSVDKIFAAGNIATGAGAVVHAIASGKEAAWKIMEFLK